MVAGSVRVCIANPLRYGYATVRIGASCAYLYPAGLSSGQFRLSIRITTDFDTVVFRSAYHYVISALAPPARDFGNTRENCRRA